ncbi:MAG: cytochrome c biogenesis protein ResB, partial [Planctomycetota bacterium]|nr:cytochrome c biogenesis protein ResB [Planctomycetota bacterium]
MKTLRQAMLWSVLAAILLLIVLSAIGARLGAEDAKDLFNSWPMVVFWLLALGLLVAGFAAFRRLVAAPAGLVMHLGVLLILGGAMWGSIKAHEFREHWFGIKKIPAGYMPILEGEAENRILAADLQTPLATLPFALYLKDFSLEHYPPDRPAWALAVAAPALDAEGNPVPRQRQFAWDVGRQVQVPFTDVHLKVLRYLPHARPTLPPDAKALLVVTDPGGRKLADLPPQVDAQATLQDPAVTLRVVKVFENLKVMGSGPQRQVIDVGGPGRNPALQVRVSDKDEPIWEGYALPQFATPVRTEPGEPRLLLHYALPQPTSAEEDPASDVPAMEVELAYGDRTSTEWLLPDPGAELARLSLAPLVRGRTPGHGDMDDAMAPELFLLRPVGDVSAYKSDIEVHQDDRKVASQVIEVNEPLHWGGYHFYQHSYDSRNESYTILSVVSDSGLAAVYLGMALLALG